MRREQPFIARIVVWLGSTILTLVPASSPDRFRAVTEAYQTLSNPDHRAAYDEQLLRERCPDPELLIPEPSGSLNEWPPMPELLFRLEWYDYRDPLVVFERALDRIFRDIEMLFL